VSELGERGKGEGGKVRADKGMSRVVVEGEGYVVKWNAVSSQEGGAKGDGDGIGAE